MASIAACARSGLGDESGRVPLTKPSAPITVVRITTPSAPDGGYSGETWRSLTGGRRLPPTLGSADGGAAGIGRRLRAGRSTGTVPSFTTVIVSSIIPIARTRLSSALAPAANAGTIPDEFLKPGSDTA